MSLGIKKRRGFWRLTPREYRALVDRYADRERREDARFGQIAAILANSNRDPKARPEPFHPVDFFPSLADGATRAAASAPEPDDLAIARSLAAFGQRGRNLYRQGLGLPITG